MRLDASRVGVTTSATARVGDALLGTRVGDRYRVERVLSRGGMGIVYVATYEQQQREVALKVLDPAIAAEPEAVERFLREAATASSLWHGHVVGVSDFGKLPDGRPYMVMPSIAGRDLSALLAEEGPLSPARAAALLEGVGSALDAMHAEGLLHRDIKPENLMHVRDDLGRETALLLDFGIATRGPVLASSELELLLGTPEFMPPEALAGESVDHEGDIYALASVAFELITGELPFEGSEPQELRAQKTEGRARTLSEASGQPFAAALEVVLARGLSRQPTERQASASAFVRELASAAAETKESPVVGAPRKPRASRAPTMVGVSVKAVSSAVDAAPRATLSSWRPPVAEAESAVSEAAPSEAEPSEAAPSEAEPSEPAPIEAAPSKPAPLAPALSASPPIGALAQRFAASLPEPARDDTFRPPPALDATFDADARALSGPRDLGRKLAYGSAVALPLLLAWLLWTESEAVPAQVTQASAEVAVTDSPSAPLPSAPLPSTPLPSAPLPSASLPSAPLPSVPPPNAPLPSAPLPSAEAVAAKQPEAHVPAKPVALAAPAKPAERAKPVKPVKPALPTARAASPRARVPRTEQPHATNASAAPALAERATEALLRGEFEVAQKGFREALAADPRHAPAWRGLGLVLERSGERVAAVRALSRYLKLQPNAADAPRIRARLDALKAAPAR